MVPHLLDDTRFNRRRRAVSGLMEAIRRMDTPWLVASDDEVRVVDRVPIPVCTYMRSRQWRTVAGAEYCGVMVSRRAKLFGFRVYVTTTTPQVVDRWMRAPASHRARKLAPARLADALAGWVLGDTALQDPAVAAWLLSRTSSVVPRSTT